MKLKRIFWVGLLVPALAGAQPAESALLALSGASAPEELSETEMERAESLGARPLRLNTDPRSRLLASGLLTPFQVASLEDYQARLGDVRSWAELARVDGFTPEVVERIRPYVSLDSRAAPGTSSRTREWSAEALVQTAAGGKTGAKVRAGSARAAASLTWRDGLSGNLTLEGKARPWRLVVGDYYARFGQGLLLWSGFTLSGYGTIEAFARRGGGIAPTWTFLPESARRGAALDATFGRWTFSALGDLRAGGAAALNVSRLSRSGQAGLSLLRSAQGGPAASADFRFSRRGTDWFGETCLAADGGRAVAGAIHHFDYQVELAARAAVQRDQAGAALGFRHKAHFLSAEYVRKKGVTTVKLRTQSAFAPAEGWSLATRAQLRWKPAEAAPWRGEVRADLVRTAGPWQATLRADAVRGRKTAGLAYAEGGYKEEKYAFYLRGTLFHVREWDDRIYCYERDAPGNFNVPAYYGRGAAVALTGTVRRGRSRLCLRVSALRSDRKEKYELKLQYRYDFFHRDTP